MEVTTDSTTDEDFDKFFDQFDELDESKDLGLCYPDGRYHVYDEALKQVIEVHPDGRRFIGHAQRPERVREIDVFQTLLRRVVEARVHQRRLDCS